MKTTLKMGLLITLFCLLSSALYAQDATQEATHEAQSPVTVNVSTSPTPDASNPVFDWKDAVIFALLVVVGVQFYSTRGHVPAVVVTSIFEFASNLAKQTPDTRDDAILEALKGLVNQSSAAPTETQIVKPLRATNAGGTIPLTDPKTYTVSSSEDISVSYTTPQDGMTNEP